MGTGDYKVRVSCLKSEEAWALFKKSVGEPIINSDPDINVHAKAMAKKCGGLPPALTVIGSTMANKKTIQEWEHAASSMEELRTDKIEGMEDDLLSVLKLSYDSLPNDTIRECFLYCCLYSEDYEIMMEELVNKWIGEGFFVDEYGDEIDKARGEGHSIIGRLKVAHLLETGHSRDSKVRMHDVIREMALWISSKRDDRFLVRAGLGLTEAPEPRKWRGNKRISLMNNNILNLPSLISDCPNLSTLMLNNNHKLSGKVSSGFFQSMTNLRVLDLSYTSIESLPVELGRLTRLRYLNLQSTSSLLSIPKEATLTLRELQMLNLDSYYFKRDGSTENSFRDPEVSVQDLDALERLQEVHLQVRLVNVFRQFLSLTKLPRITGTLYLFHIYDLGTVHLSSTSWIMDHLISLKISSCKGLKEIIFSGGENDPLLPNLSKLQLRSLNDLRMIKVGAHVALQNLRQLEIYECNVLKHFSCIRHLRCLESVEISNCREMKELIGGEDVVVEDEASTLALSFPKLKPIKLWRLSILESICEHPLLLSSLKRLIVNYCPHPKKLPLEINSAPNMEEIRGQQEWWYGLVWDDQLIKQKFVERFNYSH